MQIGVIGLNFKQADIEIREQMAKAFARRFGPLNLLHPPGDVFVPLCTCNRSEIYFSSQDLANTHSYLINLLRRDVPFDFDQKLYSYFEGDCFLHLARVTAGLDSARLFETEIQGQVKVSYEKSNAHKTLTQDIHFLFQKSLKIGKQMRSMLSQSKAFPEIDEPALNVLRKVFPNLSQIQVLFVGASEINTKIIRNFKKNAVENISLCNRSPERARLVALREGICAAEWSELNQWHRYDVVVLATKSSDYLITTSDPSLQLDSPKILIDIAVPRNVDPSLASHPMVRLVNIDQLDKMISHRQSFEGYELQELEQIIYKTVQRELRQLYNRKKFIEAIKVPLPCG